MGAMDACNTRLWRFFLFWGIEIVRVKNWKKLTNALLQEKWQSFSCKKAFRIIKL